MGSTCTAVGSFQRGLSGYYDIVPPALEPGHRPCTSFRCGLQPELLLVLVGALSPGILRHARPRWRRSGRTSATRNEAILGRASASSPAGMTPVYPSSAPAWSSSATCAADDATAWMRSPQRQPASPASRRRNARQALSKSLEGVSGSNASIKATGSHRRSNRAGAQPARRRQQGCRSCSSTWSVCAGCRGSWAAPYPGQSGGIRTTPDRAGSHYLAEPR